MSLEIAIETLSAKITDLIAVLNTGVTPSSKQSANVEAKPVSETEQPAARRGRPPKAAEEKAEPAKQKHTLEDVKALAFKVRDHENGGQEMAQEIIREIGGGKLSALKPEQYDQAAEALSKQLEILDKVEVSDDDDM